ncbi:hypothetical protein MJO28_008939, partial [Puccinia striiformis f. sp. tritici]
SSPSSKWAGALTTSWKVDLDSKAFGKGTQSYEPTTSLGLLDTTKLRITLLREPATLAALKETADDCPCPRALPEPVCSITARRAPSRREVAVNENPIMLPPREERLIHDQNNAEPSTGS